MQNLNRPYQSTASTSTRALPVRTTTTSTTTTTARPTIQNYTESQPYWNIHDLPPHHSFEYEPNHHQSKPNRITNVWYEDVPKITDDFADVHYYEHYPSEEPTTTTRVSSTRSTTISSTTPSPSTTISTTVTQSTTVATTPSQTTTLASTTSALDEYDMASKSQRKAQPRRRPDYGQRNRPQRPQKNRDDRFDQYNHKIEIKAETDRDTSRLQQQLKTHSLADYHNQNHFGQKLKGDRQRGDKAGIPELACTRPGIFQHPNDCNKYYECYWDKRINKFTLHPFECPVKLAFDSRIIGCASPNDPTVCVQY
ncbi:Chitin binding Peritrophin-A domain containing protein 9 [Sarcoptes scabiei]|uniref:Chitin binding Peritrophin-A domain containing protein 9 n=1 Tax=Sarcoptes scabiei TaxID=52283 RepID=A0A132AEJ0_SARSC|nr:Chitin binding Peritrophin-A domain containing protein 9 [Sarcoptes scabiei]